ncbi:isoamyl acetate-hydrolyzing esterase [Mycoemilia scoparia]|uniref:Isoamyl acetate-hydrolyzing esterase n=1 Tax=Mycoemilia scoparia TaxID=417184 RepID=A0A9W8A2V1_9FUNG|nr:isoamyl acetate-hydrolyzing esterase [Mycoemilia scoparia]
MPHIFFGANDAAFETHPQHVPVSRYIQNIQQMVNLITNPESQYYIPEVKILLISPPPVGDKLWIKHCCIDKNPNDHKNNHPSVNDNNIQIYNRSNGHVLKYVEALEEFSQLYNPSNNNNNNSSSSSSSSDGEKRVCFVNVWKSIMTEHKKLPEDLRNNQWDGFDQFTVDGLHLSQHGYQVVVDEILKVIGQNWPELVPENLPLHAPYWKDIVDSTKFNDEDHSCEKLLVI